MSSLVVPILIPHCIHYFHSCPPFNNQNNSAKILSSSISPFPDKVIQDEPKGARQSVHKDSNINILYLLVIFNTPLLQWFIII